MELRQDDVLICTVTKIEGATVFLKIDDFPEFEASMMLSEVAAGRIRNIREYVSVGRKVVCKVLRISGNHAEMSFRRVTGKEREHAQDKYKRERTLVNLLKNFVKNPEEVLHQIKSEHDTAEFLDEAKEDPALLEKYIGKENASKIAVLLSEKESRDKVVRKEFNLQSTASDGLTQIQEILSLDGVEIHYLGSSRFSIETSAKDFKTADLALNSALEEISKRAQKKKASLQIVKEK